MNNRLYMDLHVLQTVPPSCVNRDDTGSPKTAVYGGTTRARVSSQAWKRAMRVMFRDELLNRDQVGERTKKVRQLIAHEIAQIAPDQDAEKLAEAAMSNIGLKISGKTNDLDTLFFLSHAQAKAVAALAVEGTAKKADYQKAFKRCARGRYGPFWPHGCQRPLHKLRRRRAGGPQHFHTRGAE